jgi:hypothetical protein
MSRPSWKSRGKQYTDYGVQIKCVRQDQTGTVRSKFKWLIEELSPLLICCSVGDLIDLLCLTPLSAIFQLYHGDQY